MSSSDTDTIPLTDDEAEAMACETQVDESQKAMVCQPCEDVEEAARRMRHTHRMLLEEVPRYRAQIREEIFPYFAVGHDWALSSFSGIVVAPELPGEEDSKVSGGPMSLRGQHDLGNQLIQLGHLTKEEKTHLNFFYGGCGDCRHIYMTLYDLGRQLLKGNEDIRRGNRVHFLVNDTSPAILARCTVLLAGLHELAQFSLEDIAKKDKKEVNVLFAFLHFVLLSPVVPFYVHEKFRTIVQRLLDNPAQYPSIRFVDEAWKGVRRVLEVWLSPKQADYDISTDMDEVLKDFTNFNYRLVMQFDPMRADKSREELEEYLTTNHQDELTSLTEDQWKTLAAMLHNASISLSELMDSENTLLGRNVLPDLIFAGVHQVLPPPKPLLPFHSAEVQRCYQWASEGAAESRPDQGKFLLGPARQILKVASENNTPSSVVQDYVTNLTTIEPVVDPRMRKMHPEKTRRGNPGLHWNPLRFISQLNSSMVMDAPDKAQSTLFDLSCNLWESAAFAMKHLLEEAESSLCFEMSAGDMNVIARRLILDAEERKEKNLPTRFLRAFTSNVADYTGLVYPLVDIVPALVPSTKAFLRCNVLHGGLKFTYPYQWLESVLVLKDNRDAQTMYGVVLLRDSKLSRHVWLGKKDMSDPPTHPEKKFAKLLHRLFIGIAFPPAQNPGPMRLYPETLVAFVEVLRALLERGVDRSWVVQAVEKMLEREGVLTVDNPRPSPRNSERNESKWVPIAPFYVELVTLLSLYQPVLRLGLSRPNLLPAAESIALRTIQFNNPELANSKLTDMMGLVIFCEGHKGEKRIRKLAAGSAGHPTRVSPAAIAKGYVLDTKPVPRFFSVLRWCPLKQTVQIYLPDKEYQEMKRDGWLAVLFSSVTYKALTEPTLLQ